MSPAFLIHSEVSSSWFDPKDNENTSAVPVPGGSPCPDIIDAHQASQVFILHVLLALCYLTGFVSVPDRSKARCHLKLPWVPIEQFVRGSLWRREGISQYRSYPLCYYESVPALSPRCVNSAVVRH